MKIAPPFAAPLSRNVLSSIVAFDRRFNAPPSPVATLLLNVAWLAFRRPANTRTGAELPVNVERSIVTARPLIGDPRLFVKRERSSTSITFAASTVPTLFSNVYVSTRSDPVRSVTGNHERSRPPPPRATRRNDSGPR